VLPERKPTALKNYDYSNPGIYFVTICTQNRTHTFGYITPGGEMVLSPLGELVHRRWEDLPMRFPCLDTVSHQHFIVMPDHIHGFVHITAGGASPSPTLHQILGAFKSLTTIEVNRMQGTSGQKIWQRSGYEHIIRNEDDFRAAAEYIAGNPARWVEKYDIRDPK